MPHNDFWQIVTPDEYNALAAQAGRKRNKYGAVKCEIDGYKFDSLAEGRHYGTLKLRLQAGEISKLLVHPKFPITINGVKVCDYIADFAYEERGDLVVEDVKGAATRKLATYRLKRRLMAACYGIEVKEVMG